jgi:hypothetical protein
MVFTVQIQRHSKTKHKYSGQVRQKVTIPQFSSVRARKGVDELRICGPARVVCPMTRSTSGGNVSPISSYVNIYLKQNGG